MGGYVESIVKEGFAWRANFKDGGTALIGRVAAAPTFGGGHPDQSAWREQNRWVIIPTIPHEGTKVAYIYPRTAFDEFALNVSAINEGKDSKLKSTWSGKEIPEVETSRYNVIDK